SRTGNRLSGYLERSGVPVLEDIGRLLSAALEDTERAELLEHWGQRPEAQLAGTAHLLRASDAMNRGDKDTAEQALAAAGAVLPGRGRVDAMAQMRARRASDPTVLERVRAAAEARRFELRLTAEPLVAAAWADARRLADEEQWVAAADRLEQSAVEV